MLNECEYCPDMTDTDKRENPIQACNHEDYSEHYICDACMVELECELQDIIRDLPLPMDREYMQ